ncbi:hypothetical protein IEQ34_013114 [Dendrobium chrysotoxum]|uniref:Uncharacterized protein n=1 Tax=Dendrobium chrysotoxum TaxID=161865 RepID=A0AAV7G7H7_DENCH|nr:hypothetical protein IEQ34_013114 [Dendrobium chrysotoxum]
MFPISMLSDTIREVSALPSQRCAGSSPAITLSSTSKFANFEYLPNSGGRIPVNLLLKRRISVSLGSLPMLGGIAPEN